MINDFEADLITLVDDEGVEYNFNIIDSIIYDDEEFFALYPVFDTPEEEVESSGEYFILQAVEEDEEKHLVEVEDIDLLDKLANIFEDRFQRLFEDDFNEEDIDLQ